jgi:hypothetical protein
MARMQAAAANKQYQRIIEYPKVIGIETATSTARTIAVMT